MQNYLHAYEINRESIFIMKIKHIYLTKAQTQGYLKFSIKLYCVNTQHESAAHTAVFTESNMQNDKLMGYYGQTETTPSSLPTSASGAKRPQAPKTRISCFLFIFPFYCCITLLLFDITTSCRFTVPTLLCSIQSYGKCCKTTPYLYSIVILLVCMFSLCKKTKPKSVILRTEQRLERLVLKANFKI